MKCTRLFVDAAGRSDFDEVEIDQRPDHFAPSASPVELSARLDTEGIVFVSFPAGWFGERHTAPRRQFFLQLAGVMEVEVDGGRTVRTGPGEVTLIEDTGGSGHVTRVIGDTPVTGAFVQLPGE